MKKTLLSILLSIAGCLGALAQSSFPMPQIPMMLTTPTDRANYLAIHYWDNFDFKNNDLIGNQDVTEQGFSNFLSIMPYTTQQKEAFTNLFNKAGNNPEMLYHFIDLCEKYLYDMDSPLYDEDLYIVVLNQLLISPQVPTEDKEGLRYKLGTSLKNRLGSIATNFTYITKEGKSGSLHTFKGEYILLYFNDPTCDACKKMKSTMASSTIINHWLDSGRLKILAVAVDGEKDDWKAQTLPNSWDDVYDERMAITDRELYDLPSLPVFILLDRNYRVVQKNTNLSRLEQFLSTLK